MRTAGRDKPCPYSSEVASALPELLRGDAQRPVELARSVLPGDDLGQLDDCVVVVEAAQAREQLVAHVAPGDGHRVRVLQGDALRLRVERAGGVVRERLDLFVRDPELAADRSVDVLSELAAVPSGHAPVDERLQLRVDQPGALDALPHGARAAEDGRAARVDQVVQERPAPLLRLRLRDAPGVVVRLFGFDAFNPHALNSSWATCE